MSFANLPNKQKADSLIAAAINAGISYYQKSGGDHVEDSRREPLVQVKLWEEVCNKGSIATIETGPIDVLAWADVQNADAIFKACRAIENITTQSRFDLVFYAKHHHRDVPRGIIELKVGRLTEEFSRDLRRVFEFSVLANEAGATIDFVAAIFVENIRSASAAEVFRDHKNFVSRTCSKLLIDWQFDAKSFVDRRRVEQENLMMACIAMANPQMTITAA